MSDKNPAKQIIVRDEKIHNLSRENHRLHMRIDDLIDLNTRRKKIIIALVLSLVICALIITFLAASNTINSPSKLQELDVAVDTLPRIDDIPVIDKPVTNQSIKTLPNDFILIDGGQLMHYLEGYENYDGDKPIYKDIDLESYYICNHEVTQEEYEQIMGTNPSAIVGDNLPVNTIDVIQACQYCNERSKKEGYSGFYSITGNVIEINHNGTGYRLPTVYEWVLASRPNYSTKTRYAGGDSLKEIAWYGGNSGGTLHEICTKQPNKRGLYDLNGNVSEWLWAKQFDGCNTEMGSCYSLYVGFAEDNVYGTVKIKACNGFRVVFSPNVIGNTTILDAIKRVSEPFDDKDYR